MITSTQYFTYIIKCNDDTFYTGMTKQPKQRLIMHTSQKGSQYMKRQDKLPIKGMFILSMFPDIHKARHHEKYIKRLNKERKNKLISQNKYIEVLT